MSNKIRISSDVVFDGEKFQTYKDYRGGLQIQTNIDDIEERKKDKPIENEQQSTDLVSTTQQSPPNE